MSMSFYVSPEQRMKDQADYARKGIARGRALVALEYDDGIALGIGQRRPDVVDVDHLPGERHAAEGGAGMRANRRVAPPVLGERGRRVMQRDTPELVEA